jgi:glycosyltransferase involved in cell wall biosynthesis
MHVLLLIDVIHTGGAELFVLRLANQLNKRGYEVCIYVLNKKRIDDALIKMYANDVKVVSPTIPFYRLIQVLDGALYRLRVKISLLRSIHIFLLRRFVLSNSFDIIHSHLFTADRIAANISASTGVPVVSTMHGDYLLYQNNSSAAKVAHLLDYNADMYSVIKNLCYMVSITDEHTSFLRKLTSRFHLDIPNSKIYNGYSPVAMLSQKNIHLDNIPSDSFVVGMVARGIKEKGWRELVNAFLKASLPNSVLLLVGGGEFINELKQEHADNCKIIFTGTVYDPLPYISRMNVACLPSYYEAESLPTSIIEYLYFGKPVIASNKGEIPNMLGVGEHDCAGLCFDTSDLVELTDNIANSLNELNRDKNYYNSLSKSAFLRAKLFDMDSCCSSYEHIYDLLLSRV